MMKIKTLIEDFKTMILKDNKIGLHILIISLTISGILGLTSGAVLNKTTIKKPKKQVKIKVVENQIPKKKETVPILKEITIEVNVPLSVAINDYIENLETLDKTLLKKFKLDTSLVNVTQPGTYTYAISYKEKKYIGNVIVKEKELPIINNMTLKEIHLERGAKLPENLNDFVVETIPEEAKDKIIIDLSKVNTEMAGTYQYTVTYKENIYTGTINIYEAKPQIIIAPTDPNQNQNQTQGNSNNTDQNQQIPNQTENAS